MNIVVPVKLVPDLVEELKVAGHGLSLDLDRLRLTLNEFDDHAIEQAFLLKEKGVGRVIVIVLDGEGADEVLFTALAKGADQIIKLTGSPTPLVNNHTLARWFAAIIEDLHPGLILTGVQAHNDLDGSLGPLLAECLKLPYIGYVAGVTPGESGVGIRKEFPGGLVAEMEVYLPAVLGIQASSKPPRYVAFSKVRQAMKTMQLEERAVSPVFADENPAHWQLRQPEPGKRAEMISGRVNEVADKLASIILKATSTALWKIEAQV